MNSTQKIKRIISNFDFENVHSTMTKTDWEWYDPNEDDLKLPSMVEIILHAQEMLERAVNEKNSISSGGFWARYIESADSEDGYDLQLLFVLEE